MRGPSVGRDRRIVGVKRDMIMQRRKNNFYVFFVHIWTFMYILPPLYAALHARMSRSSLRMRPPKGTRDCLRSSLDFLQHMAKCNGMGLDILIFL